MDINIRTGIKNEKINTVAGTAVVGRMIGKAVGGILTGVAIAVPGGPQVVIASKVAAVTLPKVMEISGAAVGTILGAAWGAGINMAQSRK